MSGFTVKVDIDVRQAEAMAKSLKDDEVVRYVVSNAAYSVYQELGTRFMLAHPYMGPALQANQDSLRSALKLYGPRGIPRAVRDTAQLVQLDAMIFAPFRYGYLKNNIRVTDKDPSNV